MSGDPLRKANPGESLTSRVTAEWINTVNDGIKQIRGGNIDLAQRTIAKVNEAASYICVDVINKSGGGIDRPGGVLKIDGLAFEFDDKPKQVYDTPILKGVTPESSGDEFVILTRPLKNNQPGKGVRFGFVFCRVDVIDDTHTKAAPLDSVDNLVSSTSGVPIYWRELEGTGPQWALVLLAGGSGGGGGGTSITGKLVLIDTDIPAATVKDVDESVLTPEDLEGTGDEVVFQEPMPMGVTDDAEDSSNVEDNLRAKLQLWGFVPTKVRLPVFRDATEDDPGYDGADDLQLVLQTHEYVSDGETNGTIVVRYTLQTCWSMDTTDFQVGEYTLTDYPDYPEGETFPPDGSGTYPEQPEAYLNRRYIAQTKPVGSRQWLDTRNCKVLPAPPLLTFEDLLS